MKNIGIAFLFLCVLKMSGITLTSLGAQGLIKQGKSVPQEFCISAAEQKLYELVNLYRKKQNLAPLPLSKSLCYVASLHMKDLFFHHPDQGECNSHSWSDKGSWKPFCYPGDESKKSSVWDKPRELTTYPGKGYEIVYWENNPVEIDTVLKVWKTEPYFNSFLTNSGKWLGKKWNAIGISLYENYACAWFGEVSDAEGKPVVCGVANLVPVLDPAEKKDLKINDSIPKLPINYEIIVRTNLTKKIADQLVAKLIIEGYSQAKIIEKDEKCRVSVFTFQDKTEAQHKLKEVKKKYKDAWILKN
ncbi:MAG: CAP domain-containing protein [Bacteroidales bacterium]|nr:CAP domain-containing protein [Bacteroidales bacterium]